MPVIRVLNWPSQVAKIGSDDLSSPDHMTFIELLSGDRSFKRQLTDLLRQTVLETRIHGITRSDQTTVSFDEGSISKESRQVVIIVEGFFDRQDRTHDDRMRLARHIEQCVARFCRGFSVEVFVYRFDNVNEAYLPPVHERLT